MQGDPSAGGSAVNNTQSLPAPAGAAATAATAATPGGGASTTRTRQATGTPTGRCSEFYVPIHNSRPAYEVPFSKKV